MPYVATRCRTRYVGHSLTNEEVLIFAPEDYQRDRTKRGIVFLHGAGGSYSQGGSGATNSPFQKVFRSVLNDLRLPIISINAGSNARAKITDSGTAAGTKVAGAPDSWANTTAMQALTNMYPYATAASTLGSGLETYDTVTPAFKNTGGVILFGYSMGAAIAANWAARNPTLVKALVLVAPVTNLNELYTSNRGNYATGIDAAYNGLTTTAPVVTGTAGVTNYVYGVAMVTAQGHSTVPNLSATFAGPLRTALATTPNSLTWSWNTISSSYITSAFHAADPAGARIFRNVAASGNTTVDTIGCATISSGISGTVTSLPVGAINYAIPNSTTFRLVAADGTTSVTGTTSAAAAAGATSISVSSLALGASYNYGSQFFPTSYSDVLTADGAAYTPVTTPWTTNGNNASPSYNPQANVPVDLQAIPAQLWWSPNDAVVDTVTAVGTPGTNVQAYKDAYGSNLTLHELAGAPTHAQAFAGFTSTTLPTLLDFLKAHA